MTRPVIAFNRGEVVGDFCYMILSIGLTADPSVLLTHPCDDSDSALRVQIQRPKYLHRLHGDNYPGCVVNRTGSQVPGIEMSRDDDNLFRVLAAFEVGDDVKTHDVGECLWRKSQMQAHRPLSTQTFDQVRIFRCQSSCRDRRYILCISRKTRMRQ